MQTNRTERQCRMIITYPLMMITGLAGRGGRTLDGLAGLLRIKTKQNSAFFSPHKKHEDDCQHKLPHYVEYCDQVLAFFKDVAQLQRKALSSVVSSHGH
ncbi:hypothetical protein [Rhizobium bangladeshense]|uniref:hypothetical protein n=1 Tax=Rhizobium bangladeshense TaxID=1138189 RepID=UPI0018D3E986|nr:hypothetical protein [Rhizobium bangladeshense]